MNQLSQQSFIKNFMMAIVGVLIINILFSLLPTFWTNLFIGKVKMSFLPTFQDIMWGTFFLGLMTILNRNNEIKKMQEFRENDYLPEDFATIIDDDVLTRIIKASKKDANEKGGILPYMIFQIAIQFRTNHSISLTSDFLSKQLELFLHEVELRYNKLKYIIWLIPSLGFMGTVYGIGVAVSQLGNGSLDDPKLLTNMAGNLGVAFNTTLLALILSVILQFFTQTYEAKEETLINNFGKYILDNLINKILERRD